GDAPPSARARGSAQVGAPPLRGPRRRRGARVRREALEVDRALARAVDGLYGVTIRRRQSSRLTSKTARGPSATPRAPLTSAPSGRFASDVCARAIPPDRSPRGASARQPDGC